MTTDVKSEPTMRRYSPELKECAVRMVVGLRAETGEKHGSVKRVAEQLDIGVESLRSWVKQAEIDSGARAGVTVLTHWAFVVASTGGGSRRRCSPQRGDQPGITNRLIGGLRPSLIVT
jgi:transposase-like protein